MSKTLDLLRDGKGQPEQRVKYFGVDPTKQSSLRVLDTLISFEPEYQNREKASEAKHPAISGFDMAIAAIARLRGIEMDSKQEDTGLIPRFDSNGLVVDFVHRPFILGSPKASSSEHTGQELEEQSRHNGFLYGLSVLSRPDVFNGAVQRLINPKNTADLETSNDVFAVLQYGSSLLITQTLDTTTEQAFEMGYYGTFPNNFEAVRAFTVVDGGSRLGATAISHTQQLAQSELVA